MCLDYFIPKIDFQPIYALLLQLKLAKKAEEKAKSENAAKSEEQKKDGQQGETGEKGSVNNESATRPTELPVKMQTVKVDEKPSDSTDGSIQKEAAPAPSSGETAVAPSDPSVKEPLAKSASEETATPDIDKQKTVEETTIQKEEKSESDHSKAAGDVKDIPSSQKIPFQVVQGDAIPEEQKKLEKESPEDQQEDDSEKTMVSSLNVEENEIESAEKIVEDFSQMNIEDRKGTCYSL